MAAPPPDYFESPDYTKPVRKLIYCDLMTGAQHEFLLFISPKRIDQFRVEVNGKIWKQNAGLSSILAGLRKAIGRFSKFH